MVTGLAYVKSWDVTLCFDRFRASLRCFSYSRLR
jgi:hypothetical protein